MLSCCRGVVHWSWEFSVLGLARNTEHRRPRDTVPLPSFCPLYYGSVLLLLCCKTKVLVSAQKRDPMAILHFEVASHHKEREEEEKRALSTGGSLEIWKQRGLVGFLHTSAGTWSRHTLLPPLTLLANPSRETSEAVFANKGFPLPTPVLST